ncbi:MAG: hypothetical protein K6F93_04425 [Lachnospiraceae bacterium]|nr:hypothetical protein [Lachnospiraceae bacterium]
MKKIVCVLLCFVMIFSIVGCSSDKKDGSEDTSTVNKKSEQESNDQDKTDKNTTNSTKEASNSDASDDTKTNTDTSNSDASDDTKINTDTSDNISVNTDTSASDNTNEAAHKDLYQEFIDGTGKAKYMGLGDKTSFLDTKVALEIGKSYSWDEISEALKSFDEFMEYKQDGEESYKLIDCGSDGVKELLVEALFATEYSLHMIVKEINGELQIIYTQDGWSRCGVSIGDNGEIFTGGSAGANVHVSDYAYIDADGNYKYFYGITETLTLFGDFYAFKTDDDFVTFSTEGLDSEHTGIDDYVIEDENGVRNHYYHYFMFDDDFNYVSSDADYTDDNEIGKRFKDAGIETYTTAQINEILADKANKLGVPESMK